MWRTINYGDQTIKIAYNLDITVFRWGLSTWSYSYYLILINEKHYQFCDLDKFIINTSKNLCL